MPQYDSLGQQIPTPLLTDPPNAQTAFGNMAEAIVSKVNMRFASASVRNAIITTPVGGMVTYLQDVKRLEMYDGSAWVAFSTATTVWTDIALMSGYDDNDPDSETGNNQQGPVQYRVVNLAGETALMFRGGMHIDYFGGVPSNPHAGGFRFNAELLPASLRPAHRRTVSVACSARTTTTSSLKLDINTDGTLCLVGNSEPADSPPWVSLNGAVCPL